MIRTIRIEPLHSHEIALIANLQSKEQKLFKPVWIICTLLMLIVPGLATYGLQFDERRVLPIWKMYVLMQLIALCIFGAIIIFTYARKLMYLNLDLKQKQKILETVTIEKKQFFKQNGSYFFYTSSTVLGSIETTQEEFNRYETGDEITVEFSQYSKTYLGFY